MDRKTVRIEKQICARLRTMKNFIVSRTNTVQAAEDIYGEVLVIIWKIIRSGKFRKRGSIDSFMWRCALNSISDYYRKEAVWSGHHHRHDSFARNEYAHHHRTFARSPERDYEIAMENRLFIEKAMSVLNAIYRKILILLLFQNMKLYEIAETLKMPPTTVSWYLSKMRNRFGVHLDRARVQKEGMRYLSKSYRSS